MKINKESIGWVITSIILALLLGLSIYLGVSGWFFKTEVSYTTDLVVGKNVQIGIKKNEANSVAMSLEGSYLSDERIPQTISIRNLDNNLALYLRAKIYLHTGDNKTLKMDMVETVNWKYDNEDGYYYFNSTLTKQDTTALCSHLIIDKDNQLQSNNKYIFSIVVESLDENQDIEKIWGKNPIK